MKMHYTNKSKANLPCKSSVAIVLIFWTHSKAAPFRKYLFIEIVKSLTFVPKLSVTTNLTLFFYSIQCSNKSQILVTERQPSVCVLKTNIKKSRGNAWWMKLTVTSGCHEKESFLQWLHINTYNWEKHCGEVDI